MIPEILFPIGVVALVAITIFAAVHAVLWREQVRSLMAERDEARQSFALLTAMPEGHVCTEQVFYMRHYFKGQPSCSRCGIVNPYWRLPVSDTDPEHVRWLHEGEVGAAATETPV